MAFAPDTVSFDRGDSSIVGSFIEKELGGNDSKPVRLLKCCNQDSMAPAMIELKFALGAFSREKI